MRSRNALRHWIVLQVFVALASMAVPSGAQTLGMYSSWSYDEGSRQVEMYGRTYADYNSQWYYDLGVALVLSIYPNGPDGSWYAVCNVSSSSTNEDAEGSCSYTVSGSPYLVFDSFHSLNATYYWYQLFPCYPYDCYDWADYYGFSLLGTGGTYSENQVFYPPGTATAIPETAAKSGYVQREQQAGACSYPTAESTTAWGFSSSYPYAGQFAQQLSGGSFDGRRITESFGSSQDGCYFPGSEYAPVSSLPAGTWFAGAVRDGSYNYLYALSNGWGYDYVGFLQTAMLNYYLDHLRKTGTASCTMSFVQNMYMYCGRTSGQYYRTDPLSITLTASGIVASRAEASTSRTIP
jgi:hypothetical protein